MATMSRDELQRQLQKLEAGTLTESEAYSTLHELGRAHLVEARPVVERYLHNDDPELRKIALEVLTRHWRLQDHWQTARQFLEHDPDIECRMMGAAALDVLKRNTRDRATLEVLARVVRDERERPLVREAAYAAMQAVLHYEPKQQLTMASRGVDLNAIDWTVVNAYA